MLCNSYDSKILHEEFHWIYLPGEIKLLLVTVNNRLILEIEIVHDLSCHPIVHLFMDAPCDIDIANPSVCSSVCLSSVHDHDTLILYQKGRYIVTILSPPDSPIILFFCDLITLRNSDGVAPNRASNAGSIWKLRNFWPFSRKWWEIDLWLQQSVIQKSYILHWTTWSLMTLIDFSRSFRLFLKLLIAKYTACVA